MAPLGKKPSTLQMQRPPRDVTARHWAAIHSNGSSPFRAEIKKNGRAFSSVFTTEALV
jgi:hypothetical protein